MFLTWTKESRQCFAYFGIPYVYFTYSYHGNITVAPDRALSMGKIKLNYVLEIELFCHVNCVLMLNWIVWNGTAFDIETVLH